MNPEGEDFYKPGGLTAVAEPPPAPAPPAAPNQPAAAPPTGDKDSITWTASEYYHHERGGSWYALLLVAMVVLAGATYLLTKDYFATGTIVLVGAIVGVFAGRKPKEVPYELSSSGLRVGDKLHLYSAFKSFSIIHGEGENSISLLPLKKFMPPVDAFFGAADEEKIIDILGQHLPYEERKVSGVDRLSHKLKF
ncbi:hypothetical protein A3F38_00995 [Candidatus Saccharibacteria bacterium RIFCSPHIGHO2_12_FULL_48_21]|nr:MAG: hypothetical protein A3F38_00995 [Candidatus Saccharibacteria bacterium RIFCSPHIGHO2_12_FULL_48_21]